MTRKYPINAVGLISGTSMDAIDVACVTTDGKHNSTFVAAHSCLYAPELRARLRSLAANPDAARSEPLPDLERQLTLNYAAAIKQLLDCLPVKVNLIGLHGQTIYHDPPSGFTRQLGSGPALAAQLGIDVVDRFRQDDMAHGGQGAPLAPLYHACLTAQVAKPVVVLNLGGVANLTYLDEPDYILAFDTGPASALLDDFLLLRRNVPMDRDGQLAASGSPDTALLGQLLEHDFFAQPPPKAIDRNHFAAWQNAVANLRDADGAATLTALTAASVAAATAHLPRKVAKWLVTGGGRHNLQMMLQLRSFLDAQVVPIEQIGARGDSMEAELFAYLAVRSQRGLPLTLPATTGVQRPMTGGTLHRAK